MRAFLLTGMLLCAGTIVLIPVFEVQGPVIAIWFLLYYLNLRSDGRTTDMRKSNEHIA